MKRSFAWFAAALCFGLVLLLGATAPEHLHDPLDLSLAGIRDAPPFGTDMAGIPLLQYAQQGARVVAIPALLSGLIVVFMGIVGGLLASTGSSRAEAVIQGFGEVVGALPRMVVVLVVALLVPRDLKGLLPIAVAWGILASPGAMDEAAAVAGRLGGARFVEALRAHGFSRTRIYLFHIVLLNLRPVVVRQGVETMMQVVFLEMALSYLAVMYNQSSFTHNDDTMSWADLLDLGYKVVLEVESGHALALGLGLVALIAFTTVFVRIASRAR